MVYYFVLKICIPVSIIEALVLHLSLLDRDYNEAIIKSKRSFKHLYQSIYEVFMLVIYSLKFQYQEKILDVY